MESGEKVFKTLSQGEELVYFGQPPLVLLAANGSRVAWQKAAKK